MPSLDEMKKKFASLKDERDRVAKEVIRAETTLQTAEEKLKQDFGVTTVEEGRSLMEVLSNKITAATQQWNDLIAKIEEKLSGAN